MNRADRFHTQNSCRDLLIGRAGVSWLRWQGLADNFVPRSSLRPKLCLPIGRVSIRGSAWRDFVPPLSAPVGWLTAAPSGIAVDDKISVGLFTGQAKRWWAAS